MRKILGLMLFPDTRCRGSRLETNFHREPLLVRYPAGSKTLIKFEIMFHTFNPLKQTQTHVD